MKADRLPPHNLEAEMGVLGGVILENSLFLDIQASLRPEHFYRDNHGIIFRSIRDLSDSGKPFDSITLEEELRRTGDLHRIGGFDALNRIMESVPHPGNTRYYAEIVRSHSVRREGIRVALELLDSCYEADEVAEAPVERALGELLSVADTGAVESVTDMATAEANYRALMERRRQGEVEGLETGFKGLDLKIGGLASPRMIILAARPAMGKTGIALNMATTVARTGAKVLFVSQEMSHLELYERMVSHEGHIDNTHLRDIGMMPGRQADDLWRRMDQAISRLRPLTLWIDDTAGRTASQIESAARRIRARSGLDLVVVDYVQLLEAEHGSRANRQEQMAKISRQMKRIAMTHKVPVLVLAQLNRKVEDREDRVPRKSDLRETGALEQDADQVILIHRPEEYDVTDRPGEADLIVAKNRFGPTGVVTVNFHGPTTSFAPLADREEDY